MEKLVSYGLSGIKSTVDEDEDFTNDNLEIATLSAGGTFKYLNKEQK